MKQDHTLARAAEIIAQRYNLLVDWNAATGEL